ncbi:MAG: hypothetical protein RQ982_07335 [Gammaproteobacteria bacterium]|nr:hypothetical protein [Gammaproteobacteria bacterium]
MQQINLYQKEFFLINNYRRIGVTGSFLLLALIFCAVNFYQMYTTSQLQIELESKTNTLKTFKQGYAAMEAKVKPKAIDTNLVAQLERIKRNNAEKLRALNYLSGNDEGNTYGFSFLLQGLGKRRDSIDDLWLKKIRFSRGGYDLHLSGSSYQADLLPRFLQALSEEEIYKDREFKEIKISRSKDNKKVMDFILDTQFQSTQADKEVADDSVALFMARLKLLSAAKQATQ